MTFDGDTWCGSSVITMFVFSFTNTPRARTAQLSTFGFCVSFQEIFSSWCSGATLAVAGEMTRRDLEGLGGFLEEEQIERLHLPFAALKHLAEAAAGQDRVPSRLREVITAVGVPAAPVNNVAEMAADPQVRAREMLVERDHPLYGRLTTTGTPLKLSETPGRVRWLAPMPGEHNEEVLIGLLGHSRADLERWRAEGVI